MKARVLKPFKGVKENCHFEEGAVIELPKERIEEINAVLPGYLEVVHQKKQTKTELLEEAEAVMTNKELEEAIAAGMESPAKPRRKRG